MKLVCFALAMVLTNCVYAQESIRYNATELIKTAKEKNIHLTEKEKSILEIGEVSDTRYVLGGILGTYPLGFGIGHAIQGTWNHKGYIFTAGELGAVALMYIGLNNDCHNDKGYFMCEDSTALTVGVMGFLGLRIWEIVDVWAGVPNYREKQRDLRRYIEAKQVPEKKVSFHFAPIYNADVKAGGLGFQARF